MSGSVDVLFVGGFIHRWGAIGNWGQDTCSAGQFGASAIGVMT